MRLLISSRYADYKTQKAIKFIAHDLETWIPKSWILKHEYETPDSIFSEYWINIPEGKKTQEELILLTYMSFMSREIKLHGKLKGLDYLIGTHRDREKESQKHKEIQDMKIRIIELENEIKKLSP